ESSGVRSLLCLCPLNCENKKILQDRFILFVQMSGKWYLAGFATNAQWFLRYKGTMGMGTAMFNAVDGDLDIKSHLKAKRSLMHNLAKKTDVPGKFSYVSRGSLNDMRIVDVKYDEYALVYTVKTIGDSSDAVIKLSTEVQEKFRQFASENGVLPENIVILPKNSDCPSE
uniref:Zgc:153704 n=1 Tax=Neogobius melanostomus TaxID=47308 RepID=A0A8C6WJZ3_9GOBI